VRVNGVCPARRAAVLLGLTALACDPAPVRLSARALDAPAPLGARLPQLNPLPDGRPLVSWLEPRSDSGFTFKVSWWQGERWSTPRIIADRRDLIMFDADLHGVTALPAGAWVANWQVHPPRTKNPWATVLQVALSGDSGLSWSAPVVTHDDTLPGEHGFVATFPVGDTLGLVWLDERRAHGLAPGQPGIGLRYAGFAPDGRMTAGAWVDSVTCECCPNSAARTARGAVVVFRNRVPSDSSSGGRPLAERDIYIARYEAGRWTEPRLVYADRFLFGGCPDNGPAVDARGDSVAVAWWTAPAERPAVRVAFSSDAGATFGPPIAVDDGNPEGQVTVVLAAGGAIVGWLEDSVARARWVGWDDAPGPTLVLGPSAHHTRLPHWLPFDGGYLATWTTARDDSTRAIRMAVIDAVR
jgi:hypothetical protein